MPIQKTLPVTRKDLAYPIVRTITLSLVFIAIITLLKPLSYLLCKEENSDIRAASEEVTAGDTMYSQMRLRDGLVHYKRALTIKPDADLYFKIGTVYMDLGEIFLAEEFFLQAVRLNEEYAPAYKALGEVYVEQFEAESARKAFDKAQELFSKTGDMLEAILCKGCEKTINDIITASKLQYGTSEEKNELLKMSQADLYRKFIESLFQRSQSSDGDPQKILYYYELAAEQTLFKYPQVLCKLGTALAGSGRYEEAIKEFKAALSLRPQYRDAQYLLALAYKESGQYGDAEAMLNEIIRVDPRWPYAFRELARCYVSRGQSEKLENLPSEIKFPDYLKKKISYDADSKLLIFRGVMSKEEMDELLEISPDDSYRESVKALYEKSRSGKTERLPEEDFYKAGLLFLEENNLEGAAACLEEIKLFSHSKSSTLYKELKSKIDHEKLCKIGG